MNVPGIVLHSAAHEQLDAFLKAPTHALLLAGSVGTGKTHIADELARQLLGAKSLENHAYFRVVTPKKGSIPIEQIRDLIGFFQLKVPDSMAIKRVAIIQDADTMGHEAQNALLKLLEEPPADSVLILTSAEPQSLLTTIRSRLQTLTLPNPNTAQLTEHFVTAGHDKTAVSAALLRSGTNIAAAKALLNVDTKEDDMLQLVKQVLGGSSYERMLLVDGLSKQKAAAQEFIDTLATVAMASLQAAATRSSEGVKRWKTVLQAAHTAQAAFDRNGNPKLVLTELMLAL